MTEASSPEHSTVLPSHICFSLAREFLQYYACDSQPAKTVNEASSLHVGWPKKKKKTGDWPNNAIVAVTRLSLLEDKCHPLNCFYTNFSTLSSTFQHLVKQNFYFLAPIEFSGQSHKRLCGHICEKHSRAFALQRSCKASFSFDFSPTMPSTFTKLAFPHCTGSCSEAHYRPQRRFFLADVSVIGGCHLQGINDMGSMNTLIENGARGLFCTRFYFCEHKNEAK